MASLEGLDVQEELQSYLTSKRINHLFIKIVENLLVEKPDNPIHFIIEYLKQEYPDQAGHGAAVTTAVDLTGERGLDIESDSDSDEDEAGDELAELAELEVKPKARNRRVSVCAEVAKGTEDFVPPVHEKSEDEMEQIRSILKGCFLFDKINDDQMEILLRAFFSQRAQDGSVIIKQDDLKAEYFYLVAEGECPVYKHQGDEKGIGNVVMTAKTGDYFGELSLLYNAPRAATIKSVGESKLWVLDRSTFKHIIMSTTIETREKYLGFLQQVPILKAMEHIELCTIADALQPVSFEDQAMIIRQGDSGDKFFVIERGTVSVSQQGPHDTEPREVARLGMGSYFGEIALLTSKPRQATVSAVGPVRCLAIERRVFKRVLGPLQDVLKRNLMLYNTFMGQQI